MTRSGNCTQARGYLHGGDIRGASLQSGRPEAELLDYSANINPLGMPFGVWEAVAGCLDRALNYPDPFCRELTAAIAVREGVREGQILCGNGGADLIYRLVYALRPKKALVTGPAFVEYEEALCQVDTEVCCHYLQPEEGFRVTEKILEAMTPDLDLMFLCSPNNPTGLLTDRSLLLRILKRAEELDIRLFLDECFLDFVPEKAQYTMVSLLEEHPKLILLKSFTKLYAMPGLRLGYVLSADGELLERMRRAGQPWAVSEPAQAAGIAALQADGDDGFRRRTAEMIRQERHFLKEGLEALGLQVLEGQANYLCFRAEGDKELAGRMLERGILIRSCANYRGLSEEYYRVAVRGHEENEKLLEVMAAAVLNSRVTGSDGEDR